MKTSVLVGNGINQAIKGNGVSWGQLLQNLQNLLNASHIDLNNKFKPFPLSFEELLFAAHGSFDENIRTIKNNIAQVFFLAMPNRFHSRLMLNSKVNDIITTNYDYAFEKAFKPDFENAGQRLPLATTETKHSIKRRCYVSNSDINKSVWHIHGEINHNQKFKKNEYAAESIQIGYDHYVEYLSEIQNYLKGTKYKDQPPISKKLLINNEGVSWIDKFFTDRIVIVGLGLDFSEIDLWWLFNYRSKVFKRFDNLSNNEIIYYQPKPAQEYSDSDKVIWERENEFKKIKAKSDVLTSLGVQFEEVLCENYEEYYDNVFNSEGI